MTDVDEIRLAILAALVSAPATNPLALQLLEGPGEFERRLMDAVDRLAERVLAAPPATSGGLSR